MGDNAISAFLEIITDIDTHDKNLYGLGGAAYRKHNEILTYKPARADAAFKALIWIFWWGQADSVADV